MILFLRLQTAQLPAVGCVPAVLLGGEPVQLRQRLRQVDPRGLPPLPWRSRPPHWHQGTSSPFIHFRFFFSFFSFFFFLVSFPFGFLLLNTLMQIDLRDDKDLVEQLKSKGHSPIEHTNGVQKAKEINAVKYPPDAPLFLLPSFPSLLFPSTPWHLGLP